MLLGPDLFFIRYSPDGSFDHIPDDFNYAAIALFVLGSTLLYIICTWYIKKKKKIVRFL